MFKSFLRPWIQSLSALSRTTVTAKRDRRRAAAWFESLENRNMMAAGAPWGVMVGANSPWPWGYGGGGSNAGGSGSGSSSILSGLPTVFRSYDGTGNNLMQSAWGTANTDFLRIAPAAYTDGSTPTGADRPSARQVSNVLSTQTDDILDSRNLSDFIYAWGQFIDHDMDLTQAASPAIPFNITIPTGDPSFDPTQTLPMNRSAADGGTSASDPLQQINHITSFLDGSMVYGSDATRAAALRTLIGGKLKTSAGNLLPFNTAGLANANDAHLFPDSQMFLAGDVRANENVEETTLQTLFVREHNRLADQIAAANPKLTDEQIYQDARAIVSAEIEAITYNEYLPALLGQGAIAPYTGYKSGVDPAISNEFATAAFRFGHSQIAPDVEFLDNNGNAVADPLSIADTFFNPSVIESTGIGTVLKYLASDNAQAVDEGVVDGLRNMLFGPPGSGGQDLVALDIQRGRDHGLPDYNSTRVDYGLPAVTSFAQITSDTQLQAELQQLYGNVNNIDLFAGLLAENHLPGSSVGALTQHILVDQFTRLRDGDRFFYLNTFSSSALAQIQNTKLADIIARNTNTTNLQSNVFFYSTSISGQVTLYPSLLNCNSQMSQGASGLTVTLLDSTGAAAATTTTDAHGHYQFTGLDLGKYTVSVTTTVNGLAKTITKAVQLTRATELLGIDLQLLSSVLGGRLPGPITGGRGCV